MDVVIGIDPGMKGAAVVLGSSGCLIAAHDLPVIKTKVGRTERPDYDIVALRELLRMYVPDSKDYMVGLEQLRVRLLPGKKAAFSMGYSRGVLRTMLVMDAHPMLEIQPNKWMKASGLVGATKQQITMAARERWPELLNRSRIPKAGSGRADAAWIALYVLNM